MLPIKTFLVLFLFMSCALISAQDHPSQKPDALAIHERALVIDTHADTPGRFVDENFDMATNTPVSEGHMDFGKARAGNLGAEFFSIWVDPSIKTGYTERALDMIDSVYEQAAKHPDQMVMAFSADDILKARTGRHKRLAALMGLEGGHAIENDIRILRDFYRLGVRYMTLTWANTNEFADSSGDVDDPKVQHHDGLTDFGKQIVWEMNRLGMMVDISHVSDKTFWDAISISKAPVIASHSSARALTNVPRNMTDDMLRAVGKNGGVVQVNFNCGFISRDPDYDKKTEAFRQAHMDLIKEQDELQKQYDQDHSPLTKAKIDQIAETFKNAMPRPPLSDLIDHIDHIAKVAGIDHVGIGSDFDGIPCTPQGIDSVADLPKITQALVARGYSEQDVDKILGGNILRVFREAERVSHDMKSTAPQSGD
jgi:membrane dipeptidase